MMISDPHLSWFKLKCPYPVNSTAYASANARLNNALYRDLERATCWVWRVSGRINTSDPLQSVRWMVCLREWGQIPCNQYEGYSASWQQVQGTETCGWSITQVYFWHIGKGSHSLPKYTPDGVWGLLQWPVVHLVPMSGVRWLRAKSTQDHAAVLGLFSLGTPTSIYAFLLYKDALPVCRPCLTFFNATYEAKLYQFIEYSCNRTLWTLTNGGSRAQTNSIVTPTTA